MSVMANNEMLARCIKEDNVIKVNPLYQINNFEIHSTQRWFTGDGMYVLKIIETQHIVSVPMGRKVDDSDMFSIVATGKEIRSNTNNLINFVKELKEINGYTTTVKEVKNWVKHFSGEPFVIYYNFNFEQTGHFLELCEDISNKYNVYLETISTSRVLTDGIYMDSFVTFSDNYSRVDVTENEIRNIQDFVGEYRIRDEYKPLISAIWNHLNSGEFFTLLVSGNQGVGKTSLGNAMANLFEIPYLEVDASAMKGQDPNDWFGIREADDGTTYSRMTPLGEVWLNAESPHLILIDEVNRVDTEYHNVLMGMFDNRRSIQWQGQRYKAKCNHIILVTANIGFGFLGTSRMDKAFIHRLPLLEMKDLTFDEKYEVLTHNYSNFRHDVITKMIYVGDKLSAYIKSVQLDVEINIRTLGQIMSFAHFGKASLLTGIELFILNKILKELDTNVVPEEIQIILNDL